jgi:hypothetical protein
VLPAAPEYLPAVPAAVVGLLAELLVRFVAWAGLIVEVVFAPALWWAGSGHEREVSLANTLRTRIVFSLCIFCQWFT